MNFPMTQFKRPVGDLAVVMAVADACFGSWRLKTVSERGGVVAAATDALYRRREAFTRLLSIERGQRIEQAAAEVDLSVDIMNYYAKCALGHCAQSHLPPLFREKRVNREAQNVIVQFQPPRIPSFGLARCVALNLTIGNVVVLTHAEELPCFAVAFEHLWLEAGAPVGAFTNVASGSCRALSSIDEAADYRSASICGGGVGAPEGLTSIEADDRAPDLDALCQST